LSILSIEKKLAQLEGEFGRSAEYVLRKNADLYRRLSECGCFMKASRDWTNSLAVAFDVQLQRLRSQSPEFDKRY
jgi:hypothetical protein